jgi:predicted DNA-binding transcriptional regulator YafY
MNRFDRLAAILLHLQAHRLVSGPDLAERFGVSLRTIYRDLRSLEVAGIPLVSEHAVGYSLVEGYCLPAVMFTREEATALLTAEKLAAHLTDEPTARLTTSAMDKVRSVLPDADRDHLAALAAQIRVVGPHQRPANLAAYQQLVTAIATCRVVCFAYQASDARTASSREVEPIGLYHKGYWHVVAYCRLRHAYRDFRLDRMQHLRLLPEVFPSRAATLPQNWAAAHQWPTQQVVFRYQPAAVLPALAQQLHATKHQYGWVGEQELADGSVEITLLIASLDYAAAWLLPHAGAITILEPPALRESLRAWALRAHNFFAAPSEADIGLS